MLADTFEGHYSGACVVVLYGQRFGKDAELAALTKRAKALGLRITVRRITPTASLDTTTEAGAAPNSTDDVDGATMEFGPGPGCTPDAPPSE